MNETRQSLLVRAQTGEEAAWKDLTALYRPLILGWLHRQGVPAGDVEDLTQDVLLSVVKHLPAFEHSGRRGAFRAWLRSIIGNVLREFLRANDMYLITANAFPYGPFKGERVKEHVYEPDWRTDDRAQYTAMVADILAELTPPGIAPTIQSPPLGFKPRVTGSDVVDAYTRQVIGVVAHLVGLERRTGRTVRLALEPEPACFLELTTETLAYFADHLYAPAAADMLATSCGMSRSQAETALRRHLGVVYDICHQAVEFEDITQSLSALRRTGIPVMKLQAAAAVRQNGPVPGRRIRPRYEVVKNIRTGFYLAHPKLDTS